MHCFSAGITTQERLESNRALGLYLFDQSRLPHLITFTCYRRQSFLNDQPNRYVSRTLRDALASGTNHLSHVTVSHVLSPSSPNAIKK